MATDRILVHSSIATAFVDALKGALQSMSDPSSQPPTLVNVASKARVQRLIAGAIDRKSVV